MARFRWEQPKGFIAHRSEQGPNLTPVVSRDAVSYGESQSDHSNL